MEAMIALVSLAIGMWLGLWVAQLRDVLYSHDEDGDDFYPDELFDLELADESEQWEAIQLLKVKVACLERAMPQEDVPQ